MKYKEKEKLWLGFVKNLCKTYGWRFKGYFILRLLEIFSFAQIST
jgi:hypothetical protein